MLLGPSTQIMHSFHEDRNGSKFSWHGNNNTIFCMFSILKIWDIKQRDLLSVFYLCIIFKFN